MNSFQNKKLTTNAQNLRKSMTKEERHLWYDFLKQLPGSQYFEEKGLVKDQIRDDFLKSLGIKILRYSNLDVNQRFSAVCEDILNHINCK